MRGNIGHLSFWVWLISLNIMTPNSIHFPLFLNKIPLCICDTFVYPLSYPWTSGWLFFLGAVSHEALDTMCNCPTVSENCFTFTVKFVLCISHLWLSHSYFHPSFVPPSTRLSHCRPLFNNLKPPWRPPVSLRLLLCPPSLFPLLQIGTIYKIFPTTSLKFKSFF